MINLWHLCIGIIRALSLLCIMAIIAVAISSLDNSSPSVDSIDSNLQASLDYSSSKMLNSNSVSECLSYNARVDILDLFIVSKLKDEKNLLSLHSLADIVAQNSSSNDICIVDNSCEIAKSWDDISKLITGKYSIVYEIYDNGDNVARIIRQFIEETDDYHLLCDNLLSDQDYQHHIEIMKKLQDSLSGNSFVLSEALSDEFAKQLVEKIKAIDHVKERELYKIHLANHIFGNLSLNVHHCDLQKLIRVKKDIKLDLKVKILIARTNTTLHDWRERRFSIYFSPSLLSIFKKNDDGHFMLDAVSLEYILQTGGENNICYYDDGSWHVNHIAAEVTSAITTDYSIVLEIIDDHDDTRIVRVIRKINNDYNLFDNIKNYIDLCIARGCYKEMKELFKNDLYIINSDVFGALNVFDLRDTLTVINNDISNSIAANPKDPISKTINALAKILENKKIQNDDFDYCHMQKIRVLKDIKGNLKGRISLARTDTTLYYLREKRCKFYFSPSLSISNKNDNGQFILDIVSLQDILQRGGENNIHVDNDDYWSANDSAKNVQSAITHSHCIVWDVIHGATSIVKIIRSFDNDDISIDVLSNNYEEIEKLLKKDLYIREYNLIEMLNLPKLTSVDYRGCYEDIYSKSTKQNLSKITQLKNILSNWEMSDGYQLPEDIMKGAIVPKGIQGDLKVTISVARTKRTLYDFRHHKVQFDFSELFIMPTDNEIKFGFYPHQCFGCSHYHCECQINNYLKNRTRPNYGVLLKVMLNDDVVFLYPAQSYFQPESTNLSFTIRTCDSQKSDYNAYLRARYKDVLGMLFTSQSHNLCLKDALNSEFNKAIFTSVKKILDLFCYQGIDHEYKEILDTYHDILDIINRLEEQSKSLMELIEECKVVHNIQASVKIKFQMFVP